MDQNTHSGHVTDGVMTIQAGIEHLKKSLEHSGNALLAMIVTNLESHMALIDGRNEVYPSNKDEEVTWVYDHDTRSPRYGEVCMMFRGKVFNAANPSKALEIALAEFAYWRQKIPTLDSRDNELRFGALYSWNEMTTLIQAWESGYISSMATRGLNKEPVNDQV